MKRLFRLSRTPHDVSRDVDSELRFHLEMRTREFIEAGMTPDEARRAALEAFGDVRAIESTCREMRGRQLRERAMTDVLHGLAQDVRFAARTLRRSPGFAIAAVVTLALGIGANTAIFSVINGVLLRRLPYGGGERLVHVRQPAKLNNVEDVGFSPPEAADYQAELRSVQGVVEYHSMSFTLLGRGEARRVRTGVVSADYFKVFGVAPLLGRVFRPGEDRPGAPPVLVLGHAFWRNQLGGDPTIVGRTFEMNDRVHTVVGVLPPLPNYPDDNDVYMPVSSCPFRNGDQVVNNRTARMLTLYALLKPGQSADGAQAELSTVASRMHTEHAEAYPPMRGMSAAVTPVREELVQRARPTFYILLGTAGLVLLLACANVANLTLARVIRRERELAVRTALGAGRGRLFRLLLSESTLLALLGGVLGLLLAARGLDLLTAFASRFTARAGEIRIDAVVLLFTLLVSIVSGLLFGSMPAFASRTDLVSALKEGSGASVGRRKQRARSLLIVSQVAVSFMLLIGAGLTLRSLNKLQRVDPGYDAENVLTAIISLNWSKYTTPEHSRSFFHEVTRRLEGQAGVRSIAVSSHVPLSEQQLRNQGFRIEGRPVVPGEAPPQADRHVATPGYFRTMGIALLRGRDFATTDHEDAPPVAIVNQSLARLHWPNADPVGARVSIDGGERWLTVVGVVGDVKHYGLDQPPAAEIYFPFAQAPFGSRILVRTTADPRGMAKRLGDVVRSIDPEQPVSEVRTLEELRSNALASPRLTTLLLMLFAVLALVITATGLAGVVAFSVSQQRHEIGIRMALGAERGAVLRMVLRQGLQMVVVGLAVGLAGALALARVMSKLLFEVEATDPLTFAAVAAVLLAVAAAACLFPARRATMIDPMTAIRAV